jgi:ABC-type amino acid transport substrate-binding protein
MEQIAPLLNEAIEELPEQDRVAILERFFESKSIEEVGRTLGTTEGAAKMRLSRAVEKLRLIFRKRGVVAPTAVLLAVLSAQAAHAAPAGLASSVATLAFLKQTSASTLPIVKGTLILMAQTKSKMLVIAGIVLLLGGTTVVVQQALTRNSRANALPNAASASARAAEPVATTPSKPSTPANTNAAVKVLVFRNAPSWDRTPDFEDELSGMGVAHDDRTSADMATIDFAPYRFIIIPGAQWNTDFYQQFATYAPRFDRYVTNGGTLVLELNGAENDGIVLPRGVSMVKHGATENSILIPDHPIVTPLGGRPIHANAVSHGYLAGVPPDALVLAAESINSVADLKGKKVAFTAPTSNSGFKAPSAILESEFNLKAERDFTPVFSGKHDNSILGVVNKDYEAAAVANSVLNRMVDRKVFDKAKIRSIYKSETFPTSGYGYAHNLDPKLVEKIKEAFFKFPWEGSALQAEFQKEGKFIPIDYKKDWAVLRKIDDATGVKYTCK